MITPEHTHTFKDGKVHTFYHIKAPFKNANGEIAGIVTASVDITDQKEREKQLLKTTMDLETRLKTKNGSPTTTSVKS